MPWKPLTDQFVVTRLRGTMQTISATAWNSDTGAIRIDWPPQNSGVPHNRFSHAGKLKVEKDLYEPLDPEGFRLATSG